MKPNDGTGIVTKMSQVVIDQVNDRGVSLRPNSLFARELSDIQDEDRRSFLREYVCDATFTLMCSVTEMVRSLDGVLVNQATSVTPYVLIRSILEHTFRIRYLADYDIDPNERICRALRANYTEMREYQKLPGTLRSKASDEQIAKRKQLAEAWYLEITGKQLRPDSAQGIFDTVWRSGPPPDASGSDLKNNPLYQRYYRISSAIAHGTLWGLQHYCLKTTSVDGRVVTSSSLDLQTVTKMRIAAGRLLTSAFAATVQLHDGFPPAGAMNRIGQLEASLALRSASL